ncbi:MAG TPA: diaminopimelate decarboxylase, partial [Dehalococcoidales bacterium]
MEPTFNIGLFPVTAQVNSAGHLSIGGCDLVQLAAEYGTPLYIFDEESLRRQCREFRAGFNQYYPGTIVAYASKAYINKALAVLFKEEGLWLDAVSGGELSIAQAAGFPAGNIYFHGNNKGTDELKLALQLCVGRIVVDNFFDLERLEALAKAQGTRPAVLLRLTPGIDPHTHRKITTGNVDSKFGFAKEEWEPALRQALVSPSLDLLGLH